MLNIRKTFLIITLITLLISITAISATDINDTESVIDEASVSTQTEQITDTPVTDNDNIIQEDNIKTDNLEKNKITKDTKSIKTSMNVVPVNPSNFATVFTDGGSYSNTIFVFYGQFGYFGTYTLNLNNVLLTKTTLTNFAGTSFILKGTNYNVTGFTIHNTAALGNSVITIQDSDYVNLKFNDILYEKPSGDTHGISVFSSNHINITNNTVKVKGCPQTMGWNNESGVYSGSVAVSGIVVGNSPYVNVTNNTIIVQNNSESLTGYTTNEGLTIKNSNTQHIMAINNTINVTGAQYNYGTTVSDSASEILIHNNTFNMTGAIYNCGIQYDNSKIANITNNHIYCESTGESDDTYVDALSYGIISTCWNKGNNQFVNIENNYINLTGNITYGMELYLTQYSNITNNTIRSDSRKALGIGAYQTDYTNITENDIHNKGTDANVNNIVEVITPNNYGIFTNTCTETIVNENKICEHNSGSLTDVYAIKSTSTLNELKDNQVCVCNSQGHKTVSDSISASATTNSGNTHYECPICSGLCYTQITQTENNLNKIYKKSIKKDTQNIIITADNFDKYVTDGKLNDNVNDGDTLDFQGIFYGSRFALNIDKAVNIISSTNDAYICLDTVNNDFFGIDVGFSYTISRNGSGTNISNIYFNNTQLFVKNAENITLNNITVNNENIQLGSGVGVTSIRDNSTNINITNSHFRTKDNGGHSTLVCAWANNVLIENCTIETEGKVGNMFYTTTFNVQNVEQAGDYANNNVTFRNNYVNGLKAEVAAICYAIALEGKGHVIENNVIEYEGNCIMPQWGQGKTSSVIFRNNTIPYGICQIGYSNSTVENNLMNFSTLERVNVTNNKFGSVNIFGNVNFTDNIVGTINGISGKENVTILNNFIENIVINDKSKNYYIVNNTIYTQESYAINIGKNIENVTLENNLITSIDKNSTDAVKNQSEYTSINNTGLKIYHYSDEDYANNTYSFYDFDAPSYNGQEDFVVANLMDFMEPSSLLITHAGFNENSVMIIDLNNQSSNPGTVSITLFGQPRIIILNSTLTTDLNIQRLNYENFDKTTLIINSNSPNLTQIGLWSQSNVEVPLKIADSTTGGNFDMDNVLVYNITTPSDSEDNSTVNITNTNIETNVTDFVTLNDQTNIQFTITANDNSVENGKLILFDNMTKYGEFDVTNGTTTFTNKFTQEGNYKLIAYYVPNDSTLNKSNIKFNFTVKQPITNITIESITINPGEKTTFTATVTTDGGNPINTGKVIFKINGKILRDENNKVIYAKMTNGTAQAEYTVPSNLAGKNITITASYLGSSKYKKESVDMITTVSKSTPTLTTESINTTAGSTITLKATLTDNDKVINSGKILFKINGKTVKDANGKVIYAKIVNNTVSVEFTLPESYKSKDYTISATLISADYDRLEDTKTLTVN